MKIRFKIFDEADLKVMSAEEFDSNGEGLYGYFEISFGEHAEGQYYDFDIPEELVGGEDLEYWFTSLLEVLNLFQNKQNNYAAIRVIEYVDRWLEIKKIQEKVCLNIARASDPRESETLLLTSQLYNPVYEPPLDTMENYNSFYQEIIRATVDFLAELKNFNPDIIKVSEFADLVNSLHELENK